MTTASRDELLATLPGDLLLVQLLSRWRADKPAYVLGGAVGVYHAFGGGEPIVLGPDEDAYDLALALGVTVSMPAAAAARLVADDGWQRVPDGGWSFRATRVAPRLPVEGVAWLDPDEEGEVQALLDDGFPDASNPVGHPFVRRWAGLRRDGRLVACAADTTSAEGLGFLSSIASHPSARGTGAGAAVTAWATAALVEEHGACGLWHMASNDVAAGLYTRLGFSDDHRMGQAGPA